ncbi:sensor histidine kinase [Marinoscillum furvescens]|uniref:histidine kinase n=1 Tax=Marinoscillum furvescens DSM 4134 TaxID=1122208 RepID=A0A3D9LIF4_MARFU|nr:type IV pili methyl-accepting chemotaxis transducer N-terminal domain-containing protein [Marinoscillum furvescens]REE05603.1 signal transduction histidine kinase [Marinoscillum furvescens DSM 4134]
MAHQRFKKLGLFYLIALGCIALSIVVSQILIQTSISRQQDDSHIINIAGRQRMLSQKISKVALKIQTQTGNETANKKELKEALRLWKSAHEKLQTGKDSLQTGEPPSAIIQGMFAEINPHFEQIYQHASALLAPDLTNAQINKHVEKILQHENAFLQGMDRIVLQRDLEAQDKVRSLRHTEIYLFIISILIIVLELIFVFTPLAKSIRATVQELLDSEKASQKMTRELSKLYDELGKSYQDLEAVNVQPNSPSLFASLNAKGEFTYLAPQFIELMELEENLPPTSIRFLLADSGYQQDFIDGLLPILKKKQNWSGEIRLITEPGDFIWLESFLIPIHSANEIKWIARDITELKEAKIRSREINKERIEKSVKEQQYRSALILQGQEEERKRLSREIHDGVGQMLSAMKLLLESFGPTSGPMKKRLEDAKGLMKSIIQEVRRVSFNLTPSSLDDFGLVPAVNKFCEEINTVAKAKLTFINETRFINRLESNIETNLYRIIQEAVNNALKYAKASNITVRFAHNINSLVISIEDDGRGFDFSRVERSGHFEKAGHGIFNMKERTSYIGGVFNLETELDKGTKISITLSLDKND